MTYEFGEKLRGQVRTIRVQRAQLLPQGKKYVEGSRTLIQEATYNLQGKKSAEVSYGNGGEISVKRVFSYDDAGALKEIAEYKSDGSLILKRLYERKGNSIEESVVKGDGTRGSEKVVSTYDANGAQISVATFGKEESLSMRAIITYSEGGKRVEVAMCADSPDTQMVVASGKGRMVVLSEEMRSKMRGFEPCAGGLLISRTVFLLNDVGHIADALTYRHDNSLIGKQKFAREYDSHGNWTKEVLSEWVDEDNRYEAASVTYRIISYY